MVSVNKRHRNQPKRKRKDGRGRKEDDDDNGNRPPEKALTATPYLLIKFADADAGARPITGNNLQKAMSNGDINGSVNSEPSTRFTVSFKISNLGVVGCASGLAEIYVVKMAGLANATLNQLKSNARIWGYAGFSVPAGGTTTVKCSKDSLAGIFGDPGDRVGPYTSFTEAFLAFSFLAAKGFKARMDHSTAGYYLVIDGQAIEKGIIIQAYDFFSDRLTSAFDVASDRHVGRNDDYAGNITLTN